jgi:hypothetical protein
VLDTSTGLYQPEPVWLSGKVQTFLNKFVFPAMWICVLVAVARPIYFITRQGFVTRDFALFTVPFVVATAMMLRLSVRLQQVGYAGGHLIISNYRKEAWVPFRHVESVDSPWWYKRRMVRIRFREPTPFGSTIYYLPKWGSFRALFRSPDEELKKVLAEMSV